MYNTETYIHSQIYRKPQTHTATCNANSEAR